MRALRGFLVALLVVAGGARAVTLSAPEVVGLVFSGKDPTGLPRVGTSAQSRYEITKDGTTIEILVNNRMFADQALRGHQDAKVARGEGGCLNIEAGFNLCTPASQIGFPIVGPAYYCEMGDYIDNRDDHFASFYWRDSYNEWLPNAARRNTAAGILGACMGFQPPAAQAVQYFWNDQMTLKKQQQHDQNPIQPSEFNGRVLGFMVDGLNHRQPDLDQLKTSWGITINGTYQEEKPQCVYQPDGTCKGSSPTDPGTGGEPDDTLTGEKYSGRCDNVTGLNLFEKALFKAFQPCEDWDAKFKATRELLATKQPFVYKTYLEIDSGAVVANPDAFVMCLEGPIEGQTPCVDIGNSKPGKFIHDVVRPFLLILLKVIMVWGLFRWGMS